MPAGQIIEYDTENFIMTPTPFVIHEKKIIVEVICKDRGHWPSFYMFEAVKEVLPQYDEKVDCRELNIRGQEGKDRLIELSCALYGKEAVYQQQRLAPIPSIFINGQLVFDAIPDRDELIDAIDRRSGREGEYHEN